LKPRSNVSVQAQADEDRLFLEIAKCRADPLRFVELAFAWGEGGLAKHEGPDTWQRDMLLKVKNGLPLGTAIRIAVASGHGPGKSALVSWLILWAMSTCVDTRGVVTANTATQLHTKTWAELAKWHALCICGPWFELTATSIYSKDPAHEKTWRIDCISWSETRTEAFAGLHNQGKRILVLFDEASAIPDVIYETTEGALTDTDTEIIWGVFGNPTRNTGRFRECFPGGKFSHRWDYLRVDSRTARLTNKQEIAEWIKDYGEDSDFVRVRVKGEFPRASSTQFIGVDVVDAAMSAERDPPVTIYDPLILGVDVARFGSDKTVLRFRRGRDARSMPAVKLRSLDTMQIAARIAELNERHRPDAIFVDEGGVGAGVVDRCRYLKLPVTGVQFGASPDRGSQTQSGQLTYANKRAEMWGLMRDWLAGGALDDDPELKAELTAVEYGYVMREGLDAIILEKKEDMKKRGLASPDDADALALTFAYPVAPSDHTHQLRGGVGHHQADYNPLAAMYQRR
jgi:hypothetical protein